MSAIMVEVAGERAERLEKLAERRGEAPEHLVMEAIDAFLEAKTAEEPSLFEKILAIVDELPDEAFARSPGDGSIQHDHYIYGTPKRQP